MSYQTPAVNQTQQQPIGYQTPASMRGYQPHTAPMTAPAAPTAGQGPGFQAPPPAVGGGMQFFNPSNFQPPAQQTQSARGAGLNRYSMQKRPNYPKQ